MDVSFMPPINAGLNATATVLLILGYVAIKRRRVKTHRRFMLAAFATSVLFLACYTTYHMVRQQATGEAHTRFPDVGVAQKIYWFVLGTHLVLAFPVVPLAIVTLFRGLRGRYEQHVRIARWTLPVWLYVSATGVLVYWMLYHLAPRLVGQA